MTGFVRSARILLAAALICAAACNDNDDHHGVTVAQIGYAVTPLISDQVGVASHQDTTLVNAWGLTMDAHSFWIASNASGRVQVVGPDGSPSRLAPPSTALGIGPGITGIAANATGAFQIGPSTNRGPAQMLVASETGQIFAINPSIAPTPQLVIDRTAVGAVYKGIAVFTASDGTVRLAATDFHNGRIDVFDTNFQLVATIVIVDPNLRSGLAPFNIAALGGNIYVTYAMQDQARKDDVPGVGNGRVDVFDVDGNFVQTLLDGGDLNAPWGMALAQSNFNAPATGTLIVGNFGDGTLLAIDLRSTNSAQLLTPGGATLAIDGLWGLSFGNGLDVGSVNSLYFTAGPNGETHGMFGLIAASTGTPM